MPLGRATRATPAASARSSGLLSATRNRIGSASIAPRRSNQANGYALLRGARVTGRQRYRNVRRISRAHVRYRLAYHFLDPPRCLGIERREGTMVGCAEIEAQPEFQEAELTVFSSVEA